MATQFAKINELPAGALEELRAAFSGVDAFMSAPEELARYAHDYTENLIFMPEMVVRPSTVEEVSALLRWCSKHHVPVTPRGAGTGLSGGALPVSGGISLSLEKLNKIIEIDKENFQATVEAGVINEVFQNALAEEKLFYPPDPASKGSCFLGGNVAHSSGGPRALKYGTTKDYVLNLQVVLADGTIMWTGANTLKFSTGYHLTQLMVGSEGTLAVITKIVVKLIALPEFNVTMLASFSSAQAACACVAAIFRAGNNPAALEFMERAAVEAAAQYMGVASPAAEGVNAQLLIELDGFQLDEPMQQAEALYPLLESYGAMDVSLADTAAAKEKIWSLRRKIGEAVKSVSIYKEEDTVVPRAKLPQLLSGVKEIGNKYGFRSICYGHAGDGNLHVNILRDSLSDTQWDSTVSLGIREIFELCRELGGTISGEHGIGWVQKPYMDIMYSEDALNLMRGIKQVFDPKGILNPGKIF